jgi:hypothetical protein
LVTLISNATLGDIARSFLGRVGERARAAPLQAELAGVEVVGERAVAEEVGRRQLDRLHRRLRRDRVVERLRACRLVAERLSDRLDRVDDLAVPVAVEDRRHRAHDGAHDEGVDVDEVGVVRAQEVLVGDVAPARDRHHAVGDEHLVVHAVVQPPEVEDRRRVAAAGTGRAVAAEGIEEAHLDVRERRQPAQQRVGVRGVEVVDEQADANAALARVAQRRQQQPAGRVVLELVVLDVERRRRALRKLQSRVERIRAERQQANAGLLGRGRRRRGDLDERAFGIGRQREGVDLADVGRQRPAACEQCRGGDERSGRQPGGDRAAFLVR